jgi:DUF1680 family protein
MKKLLSLLIVFPLWAWGQPLPRWVHPSDNELIYFHSWLEAPVVEAPSRRESAFPYASCTLIFRGSTVKWWGGKGPDQGRVAVFLNGEVLDTLDTFAPESLSQQLLWEKRGLDTNRLHRLRLQVLGEKQARSSASTIRIDGFEVAEAIDYPKWLRQEAMAERRALARSEKPFLAPEQWQPRPFVAHAPETGVRLLEGPLKTAFDRNLQYIRNSAQAPPRKSGWVKGLPASSEGRLLGAAAHSLRWEEQADLRAIVDQLVDSVKRRQEPDGYCLPFDRQYMQAQDFNEPLVDERRNYDRSHLTRGMVAAARVGNPDALPVMRRFYDWLNHSGIYPSLFTGAFDGAAHNVNNGHGGGLEMYLSSLGKPEDLLRLEQVFVQDWFIQQMQAAEPLALSYYPYHVAHSYVLLAYLAWLDHYRATGAEKYLEAALGAWEVVHGHFAHVGGSIAICEEEAGAYLPRSYHLKKHTGETCGSVFWIDINQRLHQYFPDQERFAAEIEQSLFNVMLAAQDSQGNIRYHNHLHGQKDRARHVSSCCEVFGAPLLARLPAFVYSLDSAGVWVNLFAASEINWEHAGQTAALTLETNFPYEETVRLRITAPPSERMTIRLRIPAWVQQPVAIRINGREVGQGQPGSYFPLDRKWQGGDVVEMRLPLQLKLTRYTGVAQYSERERYALRYGPILMAQVHRREVEVKAQDFLDTLEPIPGQALWFRSTAQPMGHFQPYWTLGEEKMTCFPSMKKNASP